MRYVLIRVVGIGALLMAVVPDIAAPAAGTKVGFSVTGGVGVFAVADKNFYGGLGTDIYPELGFGLNVSALRLGIKAGFIYRKVQVWGFYDPGSWRTRGDYYHEYTMAFVPVQAEILLSPLDLLYEDPMVSPYIGVMGGSFVPVGDNDKSAPAFSIKVGGEAAVSVIVMYADLRYTYAPMDVGPLGDVDAGGVMLVVGAGLRFNVIE